MIHLIPQPFLSGEKGSKKILIFFFKVPLPGERDLGRGRLKKKGKGSVK
jgi:hypothetical protein